MSLLLLALYVMIRHRRLNPSNANKHSTPSTAVTFATAKTVAPPPPEWGRCEKDHHGRHSHGGGVDEDDEDCGGKDEGVFLGRVVAVGRKVAGVWSAGGRGSSSLGMGDVEGGLVGSGVRGYGYGYGQSDGAEGEGCSSGSAAARPFQRRWAGVGTGIVSGECRMRRRGELWMSSSAESECPV